MKVLITGGLGYIGSHIIIELQKHNYDVIVLDNLSKSDIYVLNNVKKITNKYPYFHKIDIRDKNNLKTVFKIHNDIQIIIHMINLNDTVNDIIMLKNIFSLMNKYNIDKLIYNIKYNIDDKVIKFIQQQDIKYIIFKSFDIVGSYFSNINSQNIITKIINTIFNENTELQELNICNNIHNITHIIDVMQAYILGLNLLINDVSCYVFEIGNNKSYSEKEIIDIIENITGTNIKYKYNNEKQIAYHVDTEKINKILGWFPKYNINDIINDNIKYVLSK